MEFAAAALSTLAGTGTAATEVVGAAGSLAVPTFGAAATTGAGLASALGATSTWATILAGGATVASVINAQRAGEDKAMGLEMQADSADLSAKVEGLQGLDRRNSLKAALVDAVGSRDVAAASSGVDLSFGTPTIARREAIKDGERAIENDQDTEDLRKSQLAQRAGNLRIQASYARSGGLGNAAALALEGGAKILRRG